MAEKKKTVAETIVMIEENVAMTTNCLAAMNNRLNNLSDIVEELFEAVRMMHDSKNQAKRNGNLPVGDTGKMAMSSEEFVISKIKDAAKGL